MVREAAAVVASAGGKGSSNIGYCQSGAHVRGLSNLHCNVTRDRICVKNRLLPRFAGSAPDSHSQVNFSAERATCLNSFREINPSQSPATCLHAMGSPSLPPSFRSESTSSATSSSPSSSSRRRPSCHGLVALATAFVAAACFVHGVSANDVMPSAFLTYPGDDAYMTAWMQEIPNQPPWLWASGTRACPSPEYPIGFQGVTCGMEVEGKRFTTAIDLSHASLPPGTPRLAGPLGWNLIGVMFLESLNLAGNKFSGPIPSQYAFASKLTSLDLSNNSFSGAIPTDLCQLNLTCLHLSNNSLAGKIPACWKNFPCADFAGNARLKYVAGQDCVADAPPSCTAVVVETYAPPPPPSSSGLSLGAVLGIVFGSLAGIALLVALFVVVRRWQEKKRKEEEQRKLAEDIETQIQTRHFGTLKRFSVGELSKACNGFDDDNLLGEGGFSKVYKGKLDTGRDIAIKKIKDEKKAGGELEFLREVEIISRAVHRNLMHSEGFCVEAGECMLVLPFYSNGSVASRTHGKEGNPLDWPARQRIARGAAEGITYLHTDCSPKLIHRDIKADNVLLDDKDEAIIADFGLAKEMDAKDTHGTTAVKGTIGYIAPEYFVSGQCSEKTDVYAFGVFLLELVSGMDVLGLTAKPEAEEMLLRDWVAAVIKDDRMSELLDPELAASDATDMSEVAKMLQVALLCMQADPNERPTMEEVAKMLLGGKSGLAEKWEKWQDEAGKMSQDEVMQVINTPAIWENTTTGISLDAFNLTGPR